MMGLAVNRDKAQQFLSISEYNDWTLFPQFIDVNLWAINEEITKPLRPPKVQVQPRERMGAKIKADKSRGVLMNTFELMDGKSQSDNLFNWSFSHLIEYKRVDQITNKCI